MRVDNKAKVKKRNYVWALVHHKCPRCREGNMFQDKSSYHLKSFMKMNKICPVCGLGMEPEQGFYYGTGYVSYALTVAFSAFTFVAWWVLIGISVEDNRVFWWMGINGVLMILLQPYFMRLSRTAWLSFFVKYNADRASEKPMQEFQADADKNGK
jgi:uncharacterized protein (DUF983 family)